MEKIELGRLEGQKSTQHEKLPNIKLFKSTSKTNGSQTKAASRALEGCLPMLLRRAAQSSFQPRTPEIIYRAWLHRWRTWSQTTELPCSVIIIRAKPGPEASFLDSQIHILHSVPSSSSIRLFWPSPQRKYSLPKSSLRLGKNQSPCSGKAILFVFHCNVQSYPKSLRNTNP